MKQKTKQAATKRFRVSARGLIQRRRTHQAHFNSRETGQQGRAKRPGVAAHPADYGRLMQLLPYNH